MFKILLADDEERMRRLVSDFLNREGYSIVEAPDGKRALELFQTTQNINLVILDVMMPYLDGWEVLQEIRKSSKVPVIMLTAKTGEQNELFGFNIGADEYITKPFSPMILVARVNAIMRRLNPTKSPIKNFDSFIIDEVAHTVIVDEHRLDLSPKEFELLVYMVENEGIALTRDQILNAVWDFDYDGDGRTVDTHIKKLRLKLGAKGEYIKTIRGLGYRFEVLK